MRPSSSTNKVRQLSWRASPLPKRFYLAGRFNLSSNCLLLLSAIRMFCFRILVRVLTLCPSCRLGIFVSGIPTCMYVGVNYNVPANPFTLTVNNLPVSGVTVSPLVCKLFALPLLVRDCRSVCICSYFADE